MKKILTKILTFIVMTAIAVTTFSGCLITTIPEKDLAQKVATVNISKTEKDEGYDERYVVKDDVIYKSELVSAFNSYGFMYVQQYGYTVSAAYEQILKSLVQNRVIVQQARIELATLYNNLVAGKADMTEFEEYFLNNAKANKGEILTTGVDSGNPEKYAEELEKYLTDYEILEAKYNVATSINRAIDQLVENDKEEEKKDEKENETYTVRTTPTDKKETAQFEYELKDSDKFAPEEYDYKKANVVLKKENIDDLKKYDNLYDLNFAVYTEYKIDNGYDSNGNTKDVSRKKAYDKFLKTLSNNGLDRYDGKEEAEKGDYKKAPESHPYYVKNLIGQYESLIVAKYEDSLISQVEANMNEDALWDQYVAEYNSQKANSTTDAYEAALDAVNEDVFVMCNPYEGYGYVANLLIGFNDEQKKQFDDVKNKKGVTQDEIDAKREELLGQLIVKDQRDSWVYSSYGEYNEVSGEFTFDDKYLISKEGVAHDKLATFNGKVDGAKSTVDKNEDKVEEAKWHFDNVVANSMSFGDFIDGYLTPIMGMTNSIYSKDAEIPTIELDETKRNALDDLMYAFSTDPGSLGNYYGYTYSPYTSDKKYVKEFAEASGKVVAAGEGAYTIVATDFGYHIIVCTKKVEDDPYDPENDEQRFKDDLKNKDSFAYKYRKIKLDHVTKDEVTKIANKFIKDHMDKSKGKVIYFEKNYKDLITEPTKEEK